MCIERRRFSQTMASEWQTAFVVCHKMPWCALLTAVKNYNKSLQKLQDFFFKTETKTKTKISRPRLHDPRPRPKPRLTFCPRGTSKPRPWSRGIHHCWNVAHYNESLGKTARLFLQDRDQDQMFKTETKTSWSKTKTFISVLEARRDQDPGLEDYITALTVEQHCQEVFVQVVSDVSGWGCVQTYERMNVADALQTKYYDDGEAIINQVSRLFAHTHRPPFCRCTSSKWAGSGGHDCEWAGPGICTGSDVSCTFRWHNGNHCKLF